MILSSPAKALRDEDLPRILDGALTILATTGVSVEYSPLLARLAEHGAEADAAAMRARIPRRVMEAVLSEARRVDYTNIPVTLRTFAGVYQGWYLDPDGEFLPWTHELVLDYARLAQNLPHVENMFMLGYPVAGVPDKLRPLYEKLYCWRYGIDGGKSIWETSLCEPIQEMWRIYADARGEPAAKLFNGTVYLISPLRFAREEAAQFWYFQESGLRVTVGQLGSLGATTPVTLAGALALHLAEGLFINFLNRVFFGDRELRLYNSVSAVDMSTGIFQYGRPEQVLLNAAGAQMAAYLGAHFEGHGGLSDAKTPGYQSAAQKAVSALGGALAYGSGILEAGLLGVDEINSPIQMILDDELAGSMRKTFAPIPVDAENLALDVVDSVGPGGTFLECEHTFEHFRDTLWFPSLWSKESYALWKNGGGKDEIDLAREKYRAVMATAELTERLPADTLRALEGVVERVRRTL